ncbi:PEP-CTERM sorting domain-containing protein [Pelomonas sp. KK5]
MLLEPAPVPEPATGLLMLAGLGGVAALARRRRGPVG